MSSDTKVPSYQKLFAELDGTELDAFRTVLSPAAYLADLLELVEDTLEPVHQGGERLHDLFRRRPDLLDVPLGREATTTQLRTLDIVNERLKALLDDEGASIADPNGRGPLLPLDLDHRRASAALDALALRPLTLLALFEPSVPPAEHTSFQAAVKRWQLDLSSLAHNALTRGDLTASEAADRLSEWTRLDPDLVARLVALEPWCQVPPEPEVIACTVEAEVVEGSYEPPPTGEEETREVVPPRANLAPEAPPPRTDVASTEKEQAHQPAIDLVAWAYQIHRQHGRPAEQLLPLLVDVDTDDTPVDQPVPRQQLAQQVQLSADQLSSFQQDCEATLPNVVWSTPGTTQVPAEAAAFTVRMKLLADLLALDLSELWALFAHVDADASFRAITSAHLVFPRQPNPRASAHITFDGPPTERAWLFERLFLAMSWLRPIGIAPSELGIPQVDETDPKVVAARDALADTLVGCVTDNKPTQLTFERAGLSPRTARRLFELLDQPDPHLVSPLHPSIVLDRPDVATDRALALVTSADTVTPNDLVDLQLGTDLARYAQRQLQRVEVLDHTGAIVQLPEPDEALALSVLDDATCARIHAAVQARYIEAAEGTEDGDPVELAIYASDLRDLAISDHQRDEYIDALTHLGILTTDGMVRTPALFAPDSEPLHPDIGLQHIADDVLELLRTRVDEYISTPVPVNAAAFAPLDLPDATTADLIENLVFNNILEDDHTLVDPDAVLALAWTDLEVGLAFFRHRRSIHATLQGIADAARTARLRVAPADLEPITHTLTAKAIHRWLETWCLQDGRLSASARQALRDTDDDQLPMPGHGLSPAAEGAVLRRLQEIEREAAGVTFSAGSVAPLGFSTEQAAGLIKALTHQGILTARGAIAPAALPWFERAEQALQLSIPGFEDYERDVFFRLQDVCARTTAGAAAVAQALQQLAQSQHNAVIQAVAEHVDCGPDVIDAVAAHVIQDGRNLTEAVVAPLLATATDDARTHATTLQILQRGAFLATRVGLPPTLIGPALRDQGWASNLPERLVLPPERDRIQAVLHGKPDRTIVFTDNQALTYREPAGTLDKKETVAAFLGEAAQLSQGAEVQAAYIEPDGTEWVFVGNQHYCRTPDATEWTATPRAFALHPSPLQDARQVDAAFIDRADNVHLLVGDRALVREATHASAPGVYGTASSDEAPSTEALWRHEVGEAAELPELLEDGADAVTRLPDGSVVWFVGDRFVSSRQPDDVLFIRDYWGLHAGRADRRQGFDGIADIHGKLALFAGRHVFGHVDAPESTPLFTTDVGPEALDQIWSPTPVIAPVLLPPELHDRVDAGFTDWTGHIHLFADQHCVDIAPDRPWTEEPTPLHVRRTVSTWGLTHNPIAAGRPIDAAFIGSDGHVYIFAESHVYRYSRGHFRQVDEGWPRALAQHWGGLQRIEAAVVFDGDTYCWGTDDKGDRRGVKLARKPYGTHGPSDATPIPDAFWSLPDTISDSPDAVVADADGTVTVFAGDVWVRMDPRNGFWSQPKPISEAGAGLDGMRVDAGFTGRDGRPWLFVHPTSGDSTEQLALQYTSADRTILTPRSPRPVHLDWGHVVHNLHQTGRVDAAVCLVDPPDDSTTPRERLYIFSGDQYTRWTRPDSGAESPVAGTPADEGYPRRIRDHLHTEPRFVALPAGTHTRIDGAYGTHRTVYLVVGDTVHAISDDTARRTPVSAKLAAARAPVRHHGQLRLNVHTASGHGSWHRLTSPDTSHMGLWDALDRTLEDGPQPFREAPDAILDGADGDHYRFQGTRFWSAHLDRVLPTSAVWGRVDNPTGDEGRVDAALRGPDGRVYLFAGPVFVTYTPDEATPDAIPERTDGLPERIADHWGGLRSVQHAFIWDDTTYLVEHADPDGTFRVVTYSGTDLSTPDQDQPELHDATFWDLPAHLADRRIDAVVEVLDDLYFITDNEVIVRTGETDTVGTPVHAVHVWPGFPTHLGTIQASLAHEDGGLTLFFSSHHVRLDPNGKAQPNQVVATQGRLGRLPDACTFDRPVDATIILGEHTYLFAADRYIRYTGTRYDRVDAGYPKKLADGLLAEPAFQHFGDALQADLDALTPDAPGIRAAWSLLDTLTVSVGGALHSVASTTWRTFPLSSWGRVRDTLHDTARVDAAFVHPHSQHIYLLSGDQYTTHSGPTLHHLTAAPPRSIETDLCEDVLCDPAQSVGPHHHRQLDAAFVAPDGALYLFKNTHCRRLEADTVPADSTLADWATGDPTFAPTPDECLPIDGAMTDALGALYVFKDALYLRFSDASAPTADPGFPRRIAADFDGLTAPAYGITGAFTLDHRRFVSQGDAYVRYSGTAHLHADPMHPRTFAEGFSDRAHFALENIRALHRFATMVRTPAGQTPWQLIDGTHHTETTALEATATWLDLTEDEVGWLLTHVHSHGPGRHANNEAPRALESLAWMHDVAHACKAAELSPEDLKDTTWAPLWSTSATALCKTLDAVLLDVLPPARHTAWTEGVDIDRAEATRTASLARLTQLQPDRTAHTLTGQLLVDVNTGHEVMTSRVREATAAVQRYFTRFFMALEHPKLRPVQDKSPRKTLKTRWAWLSNYRVWEANRKTFLFPENYLLPELRTSRTPSFQTLQDTLMGGASTEEATRKAYQTYLNEYAAVSRLKTVGAFRFEPLDQPNTEKLIILGRTREEPYKFYSRWATFRTTSNRGEWTAWEELGIEIPSDEAHPVFAFGRVFVFWHETRKEVLADVSPSWKSDTDANGQTTVQSPTDQAVTHIDLRYSYYDLNGTWQIPQTLDRCGTNLTDAFDTETDGATQQRSGGGFKRISLEVGTTGPDAAAPRIHVRCLFTAQHKATGSSMHRVVEFSMGADLAAKVRAERQHDSKMPVSTNTKARIQATAEAQFDSAASRASLRIVGEPEGGSGRPWLIRSGPSSCELLKPNTREHADDLPSKSEWVFQGAVDAAFALDHDRVVTFDNGAEECRVHGGDNAASRPTVTKDYSTFGRSVPSGTLHPRVDSAWCTGDRIWWRIGDKVYASSKEDPWTSHPQVVPKTGARSRVGLTATFVDPTDNTVWHCTADGMVVQDGASSSSEVPFHRRLGRRVNGWTHPGPDFQVTGAYTTTKGTATHTWLLSNAGHLHYTDDTLELATLVPSESASPDHMERAQRAQLPNVLTRRHTHLAWRKDPDGTVRFGKRSGSASPRDGHFDAVVDRGAGAVLLFRGNRFMEASLATIKGWTVPEKVEADFLRQSKPVAERFGTEQTPFTEASHIDWAARFGDTLELHAGGSVIRYNTSKARWTTTLDEQPNATPVQPPASIHAPDAVVTAVAPIPKTNSTVYFLQGGTRHATNASWYVVATGDIPTHLGFCAFDWTEGHETTALDTVDAAIYDDHHLVLIADNRAYHYTLLPEPSSGSVHPLQRVPRFLERPSVDLAALLRGDQPKSARLPTVQYIERRLHPGRATLVTDASSIAFSSVKDLVLALSSESPPSDADRTPRPSRKPSERPRVVASATLDRGKDKGGILFRFHADQEVVLSHPRTGFPLSLTGYNAHQADKSIPYSTVRLTSSTAMPLQQRFFERGLDGLLSLDAQWIDELPKLAGNDLLGPPTNSHLDFASANGIYYWEMFFHAPVLIAQHLAATGQYAEARTWLERIFDPTEGEDCWRFVPFLSADIEGLIAAYEDLQAARRPPSTGTRHPSSIGVTIARLKGLTSLFEGTEPKTPDTRWLSTSHIVSPRVYEAADPEATAEARQTLQELNSVALRLEQVYDASNSLNAQLSTYLDDPANPHAIANLRSVAYRRHVVMTYIDNLLDHGDSLFASGTRETLAEAHTLYLQALDLLGSRPKPTQGKNTLPDETTWASLRTTNYVHTATRTHDDFIQFVGGPNTAPSTRAHLTDDRLSKGLTIDARHLPVTRGAPYFSIPENGSMTAYWDRVEDRLYKLRHSLDLQGNRVSVPLFAPPIDPIALASAAAAGGLTHSAGATSNAPIPHQRFVVILQRARDLASRAAAFGSELLATLDRCDEQALAELHRKHQQKLSELTIQMRTLQLKDAHANRVSTEASLEQAQARHDTYQLWLDEGLRATEITQLTLMTGAVALHALTAAYNTASAMLVPLPEGYFGPFNFGLSTGGDKVGKSMELQGAVSSAVAETLSLSGEVMGIAAQHERTRQDWEFQRSQATYDIMQLDAQLHSAKHQVSIAEKELDLARLELAQAKEEATHYQNRFTSKQLYTWTKTQLAKLYGQTYRLALQTALSAQQAFRFEAGTSSGSVQFIQTNYWNTSKQGLLAAELLALDLDHMEQAWHAQDGRGFEISRDISLARLDPMALLSLRTQGTCDFHLTEALFDEDFPGHFCRQVKTIAITFHLPEGTRVNATLTQLSHKTVLSADIAAVRHLLKPEGPAPGSIRADWRPNQQVALSHHDQYEPNNGLFELRFDSENYLPFECTGAISSWRLALSGRRDFDLQQITDVTVKLKYTAEPGPAAFARAVKDSIQPYPAYRLFHIPTDFPDAWQAFQQSDTDTLQLPIHRDLFPDLASSKVLSLHPVIQPQPDQPTPELALIAEPEVPLPDQLTTHTSGLKLPTNGSPLLFRVGGKPEHIALVVGYLAKVS